ncbi:formate dehydrogenase, alpha subunit [Sulfobacillus acidophilus TPY]|uniref:Formate dehydrogenase, alpha subunit n=1 Tax=Sulfobacillus acidophilus (strain ATCC 700253 / DSM 10332 / NAL) TaxID=679936 RepID=G8TS15_SULAD|nr:formate dehydrogenase, alpha subunit [Sulfobacillus acidophilus TPY]AEW04341.1 formate dehydrogenase, alpha subunit [Sulfobacillus acidophilus DSM 10332]
MIVEINGNQQTADAGQTILSLAEALEIPIPHICFHPQLGAIQTCDTCVVELNGDLVRACATEVTPGSRIYTDTPEVRERQVAAMNQILHNHQLYCTVCDNNNGDCLVHNTTEAMGIRHQTVPFEPKPYEPSIDATNPFYRYDVNQCILCGRCVEACQNLEVNETLSIDWTLERPRVIWDQNVPIGESSCVSCGHCVTVCPCNALMEKSMIGQAGLLTGIESPTLQRMIRLVEDVEPSLPPVFALSDVESHLRRADIRVTKTVCTYCGVGCSFDIWTKGRQILKVQPTVEAPTNGISTCVKGKFGWDFVNHPDRLTTPLIREGDHFRPASWDEALSVVAERLFDVKSRYGPDAVMFIASSKASNEEAYLTQKLARTVIGTNNVDNDSTYCQDPATYGLRQTVGYGADSGTIQDVAAAALVLIIGSNTAESHPVFATRVKRSHKLGHQKLVVVDIRRHEMAERADLFISPRPGTDPVWLLGLSKYLADQKWLAYDFLASRVEGLEEYLESLAPYSLDYTETVTGVPRDLTMKVAQMIHDAPSLAILWAMGITQQRDGSEASLAIANLLLLTGNFGRPGTGAYPLRGHNNVQGASDFGAKPLFFPGYQDVRDPAIRRRLEALWQVPLPSEPGLNNQEIAGAIHQGRLKALYIVGEDTAVVDADARDARDAFSRLDFLVVQDIFLTKTAQYADVVLPASPSLEKEGTFTNTERRIQHFYPAMEPLGDSWPDWKILQAVAHRMGANWPEYIHPREIMAEAAQAAPLFAGVNYDRLDGYHTLVWPVKADGQDEPLLYRERFHTPSGKARLVPVHLQGPNHEAPSFDLHVNNGQLLEHFHEGNLTYRVPGIQTLVPQVFLEVSPELARERDLTDGTWVRLTSPTGWVEVPVLVTDRVRGTTVYLPMNAVGTGAINDLTGTGIDTHTKTPAYKDTVAYLEVIRRADTPEPPLPRRNWRFHRRNPQPGVQVELKWARSDYEPINAPVPTGVPGR